MPYGRARGSITERGFSSTIAANNGSLAKPDEDMSCVSVDCDTDEKFLFRDAVQVLKDQIVGPELWERYQNWPMYSKFFDNENPPFQHLHL